jgi:hypothetical protein
MSVERKADSATVDNTTACSDLTQPALAKSAPRASDSRFNGHPDATKRNLTTNTRRIDRRKAPANKWPRSEASEINLLLA